MLNHNSPTSSHSGLIAQNNVVSIEVAVNRTCASTDEDVIKRVKLYLQAKQFVNNDVSLTILSQGNIDPKLWPTNIDKLYFHTDIHTNGKKFELSCLEHEFHVYRFTEDDSSCEEIEGVAASTCWILPNTQFEHYWDTLFFDDNVKENLISYGKTMLLFSDVGVNNTIISSNRVVLLHGPPGTGKTTLCKALAQKLTIRMSSRYSCGQLLEVNSHSLFSKWFSESGKQIHKLFDKIKEIVSNPDVLLFVLIDEVESLTIARQKCLAGNEPSDSVRAVNALLTQIDNLRKFPNVLILCTSNLSNAVDEAFIDRADIKQYIDLPSPIAIYEIYRSTISELDRTGIVYLNNVLRSGADIVKINDDGDNNRELQNDPSLILLNIARKSYGLSGRTLRKLPVIVHAFHLQVPKSTLDVYLQGLSAAVDNQLLRKRLDAC